MKTYENMTPEEQVKHREGVLYSAVVDAWYTLSHAESYVQSGTFASLDETYAFVIDRLKRAKEFVDERRI